MLRGYRRGGFGFLLFLFGRRRRQTARPGVHRISPRPRPPAPRRASHRADAAAIISRASPPPARDESTTEVSASISSSLRADENGSRSRVSRSVGERPVRPRPRRGEAPSRAGVVHIVRRPAATRGEPPERRASDVSSISLSKILKPRSIRRHARRVCA